MFEFLRDIIEGITQDVTFAFSDAFSNVSFAVKEVADTVVLLPLLVGFVICDMITPDTIIEEIPKQLDNETLKKAFAAKVKEKEKESVSVNILDEWDEPLGHVDIKGESVSDDIYVGMVIKLK